MYNFSESQKQVFEKYLKDENVFITGPGGSGKSYLIKCIYHDAIEKHKNIKICALTGCASILLGCKATTLHRFAGIGLANKSIDEVVSFVFKNKYKLKAWYSLNILIIDEVSMMNNYDKELIFERFSTCKIIMCGDIGFQLEGFKTGKNPFQKFIIEGFDNIVRHDTNYRVKDKELLFKLNKIRTFFSYR